MRETDCPHLRALPHDQLERLATLGLCAAELIHELSDPLTIMLGRLELMKMAAPPEGDAAREQVAQLHEQAIRLKWLVDQLRTALRTGLDLAALVHPRLDDLTGVVRGAVRTAQSLGESAAVTFDEAHAHIPPFPLDAKWLRRALLNLLKNAVDAIGGSGTISVRTTWRSADSVEVSIADTGPGIDPKTLDTLFTPLVSAEGDNGFGLGLALCQTIVTAHRGRIEVASAPGLGTTFRIVLPTDSSQGLP